MPVTVFSYGTFQTKVGTSHTLTLTVTPGVFQFKAYTGSMVSGDNVDLKIRTAVQSGGTMGLEFSKTLVETQSYEVVRTSIPVTTVTTGEYIVNVTSSGVANSGTGSNGPQLEWAVLSIN